MTRIQFEKHNEKYGVISASLLTSKRLVPRHSCDFDDIKYTRYRFENGKITVMKNGTLNKMPRWVNVT